MAVIIALFSSLLLGNTLQVETRSIIIAYPVLCLKSNKGDKSEEACLVLVPVKRKKAILSDNAVLQLRETGPDKNTLTIPGFRHRQQINIFQSL